MKKNQLEILRVKNALFMKIKLSGEYPLWSSRDESTWCPWGYWFDSWSRSADQGSGIAMSCGVGHRNG